MPKAPPKIKIPDAIKKYIGKDAPKEAKMMAARAAIPMAPLVQVTVLIYLTGDPDTEVSQQAKSSLLEMPPSLLTNTLSGDVHPKALDFFAKHKPSDQVLIEKILLNKHTPDETFVFLADKAVGKSLDIIAGNQQRMLRRPEIANAFKKNPNVPRNVIEKVVSFLRMSGIQIEGESPILSHDEISALMKEVELQRDRHQKAKASQSQSSLASPAPSSQSDLKSTAGSLEGPDEEEDWDEDDEYADTGSFDDDELYGGDDLFEERENVTEDELKGIAARISKMSVPQKVKLALMGNKEVRSILIKDSNKIVSSSVIKSPKITDNEVHSFAQMRSINDEIIRYIANNKDWVKNYSIKLALANNPKTPISIGLKFLQYLNIRDTAELSRNKNVSPQLQKLSKEKFEKMRG